MKQYPPNRSQPDVRPVAMLALTVAMCLFFALSMSGGGRGAVGPLDRPLEAPRGLGL